MEPADNDTGPKGSNRHCFLCRIKLEEPGPEDSGQSQEPLRQYLSSYLKVDVTKINEDVVGAASSVSSSKNQHPRWKIETGDNWTIRFCEACLPIKETFLELYGQLQQIQLEMTNVLQRIDWKLGKQEEGQEGHAASEGSRERNQCRGNEGADSMIGLRQEIRQKCCQKLCSLLADQEEENAEWTRKEPPKLDSRPSRSPTLTIRHPPVRNSSRTLSSSEVNVKTEPPEEIYEDREEDSDSYAGANYPDEEDLWREDLVETNYQNQIGASNVKTEMPELDPLQDDDDPDSMMDFMNDLMEQQPSKSTGDSSNSVPNDDDIDNSNPPVITYPLQFNSEISREPPTTIDPVTGLLKCICGKGFKHSTSLRNHYNNAHLQIRYRCRLCQKEFGQPYHYKRHNESDHLRGRLITCKYCNKGFTLQSKLTRHVQNAHLTPMVEKQKLVQCQHCRETFAKSYLSNHRKRCPVLNPHPSNKSFECHICHQTFLSVRLRTEHQWAKHSGDTFGCDRCHETFKYRAYKYKHKCTYTKGIKKEPMDPLAS